MNIEFRQPNSAEPFAKFAVEHDILLANVMCHS